MNKREAERRERLLPGGVPRYIRVYDNGGQTIDRYTVVFTGNYRHNTGGEYWVLAMNSAPFWPGGFCQHDPQNHLIDYPTYGHLGKKIPFTTLPEDCQAAVMTDYLYLWSLDDMMERAV